MFLVRERVHQDLGIAGGVLDAVLDEVVERVGEMRAVAENLVPVGVQRNAQHPVRGIDQQRETVRDLLYKLMHVKEFHVHLNLPLAKLCGLQHRGHHILEPVVLVIDDLHV